MPRAAAKLFPEPEQVLTNAQRRVLAILQDIEAVWRRLAKQHSLRNSLFSIYQQQVLPWQHQLSERKAELATLLLQHANNPSISEQQRMTLMDWLDELLEELEYCHFNSPLVDLAALGQQFMDSFADQWLPFAEPEPDADCDIDLPEEFASLATASAKEDWLDEDEDDMAWPALKLDAAKVHSAMVQKLAALLPLQAAAGDGTEQQVRAMLLACYQQLLQNQLATQSLEPLIRLMAVYRQKIDRILLELATGDSASGWVLMTFGSYTKAELPPALSEHIADLRYEIKALKSQLKQSQSLEKLKLMLDEDAMMDDGELEPGFAETQPNTYH